MREINYNNLSLDDVIYLLKEKAKDAENTKPISEYHKGELDGIVPSCNQAIKLIEKALQR